MPAYSSDKRYATARKIQDQQMLKLKTQWLVMVFTMLISAALDTGCAAVLGQRAERSITNCRSVAEAEALLKRAKALRKSGDAEGADAAETSAYTFLLYSKQRPSYEKSIQREEGYLDKNGRLITRFSVPHADADGVVAATATPVDASSFSEGLAAIKMETPENRIRWGYINRRGQVVIPPRFLSPAKFHEGLALQPDLHPVTGINGVCFIDKRGKKVIGKEQLGKLYDGGDFSNGRASVCLPADLKWGFVDNHGQMVIPAVYKSVGTFSEGLAFAELFNGSTHTKSIIDTNGATIGIIPNDFTPRSTFHDGLMAVSKTSGDKEQFAFLNHVGDVVIPPFEGSSIRSASEKDFFVEPYAFHEGIALVVRKLKSWSKHEVAYIDKTGKAIAQFTDVRCASRFADGLAAVEEKNVAYFIDRSGRKVSPNYFQSSYFADGMAMIGLKDQDGSIAYSFIGPDLKERFKLGTAKYETGTSQFREFSDHFSEGLLHVALQYPK
jgi:hypothetical protein